MKKLITLLLLTFAYSVSSAQDMFGIANSNYAGLNGIGLNPSSIVDSRLGVDINLITFGFTFDNNYVYIPKENLTFFGFGNIVDQAQNKYTGYTDAKNYPGDENKNSFTGVLVRGPSGMFNIGKSWFGITLQVRALESISDVNYSVAKFAYEDSGLHYAPLQNQLLNSGAFSISSMAWGEIGLTYGSQLVNQGKNYLKGAFTIKRLIGYAASYKRTDGFTYQVDSNVINFYGADVEYGHSFNEKLEDTKFTDLSNNGRGWGFDFGLTYEYRPDAEKHQYEMDGKKVDNPEENHYKWKVGASLYDLGKIRFDKNAEAFNLKGNGAWVGWDTVTINSVTEYDTTLSNIFYGDPNASNDGKHDFDMAMPHAFSLQFDYSLGKNFYANATWIQRITTSNPGVVASNNVSITPRFEKNWIDVALPISYYNYDQFRMGIALRLGSFIIGSDKIGSLMALTDMGGMDVYTSLKFSIGRSKIKDKDNDAVSDKMDKCPEQRGSWATFGCPDADGDNIIDKEDACPTVPGIARFLGCPDTDGDGIQDKEDDCPTTPGLAIYKGCPDTDGDSIPDPQDTCPTVKGPPELHGCPDTDGDGIIDRNDSCPDVKGIIKFYGCPDTDDDGIIDRLDSCPNVKGPASNKGCPVVEMVEAKPTLKAVLTKEEEEVIAKVFNNLEFETGKSVIRQTSYASLNELVELLKRKPAFRLLIDGHTDNVGSAASNMKLSNNRANAVKLYLTERGIDASRITATGYGMTRPIASNKTVEGRQKNRRVEFTIMQ